VFSFFLAHVFFDILLGRFLEVTSFFIFNVLEVCISLWCRRAITDVAMVEDLANSMGTEWFEIRYWFFFVVNLGEQYDVCPA
jgi:hypothetical protein